MSSTKGSEPSLAHLVVVGSSAGGIDALSSLVSQLPEGFQAPVVVAQHLQPTRRSHLGEILARRTKLPVVTVEKRESLQPGHVYVVPANRDVNIRNEAVAVSAPKDGGPTPSVDHLLSTAAEAYGEGVVAVILTGSGSDGSSGAREVKAAGGTVVIQNPETAAYPSMPASVAPNTVDVVAELDAIGPLLEELVTGARLPRQATDDRTLEALLSLLRERSGIDFSSYKRPTILRRLQRRLVATESADLRDYFRLVQRSRHEYQRLASNFLIKVTGFFRDPELFAELRDVILPELIDTAAARDDRELRIWSAGCATGEEAYSLAILASEAIGGHRDLSVRIFATDLDNEAVAFARRGIYPSVALANVPESIRDRYFAGTDGEYEISEQARSITIFGQHDLAQRSPFSRIDLVLCRNVLIYFTAELQKRALQLFAFSLRDGGYLVLGKAETTSPLPEYFALAKPRLKVFRRQGERAAIPALSLRPGGAGMHAGGGSQARAAAEEEVQLRRGGDATSGGIERADTILLRLPMGVVAVNRDYDIQQINPAARRLLGIHGNAVKRDLVHLASGVPSDELRRHIDRAFGGESSRTSLRQANSLGEEPRTLDVRFEPYTPHADRKTVQGVLLMIDDITASQRDADVATKERQSTAGEMEGITRRAESLAERNELLLAANDELATANADLRAANDELLVATEEARASTEQVETLNEELQATNEELETLNEELQATVEELNTTNDDLEARSDEVRRMAASLENERGRAEEERSRLAAVLESMSDAVVVIDSAGDIVLTNPAYERIRTVTALYAPDGAPLPPRQRPLTRAARGEPFIDHFFSESRDGDRFWYEAAARPIADGQEGVVLVIRDITERNLREFQEQFLAIASHELRTPLTVLQGYLQMLERQLGRASDGDARPPYLVKALAQTRRISELITNFLDVSRLQAGKLTLDRERLDLAALVNSSVEIVRGLAQRQTINVSGEGPIPVEADPARLEQVLLNLLTNAIRYAPDTDRIDVRYRAQDGEATVEVDDYGPGIPARDQRRLFRRFYQAPAERAGHGLGLGLHIASEIVKLHGGRIGVRSQPGKGSTFWITLPVAGEEGPAD